MYTAQELADLFDLSVHRIYQLVGIGVLPRAHGRTRNARYGKEHVAILKAYRERIPRQGDRFTAACFAERRQAGGFEGLPVT